MAFTAAARAGSSDGPPPASRPAIEQAAAAEGAEPPANTPAADTPLKSSPTVAALLEVVRQKHSVPAMVGAIVTDAGLQEIGATGVREVGKPDTVTIHDLFHLGSCTKAMTATLAAVLVERGKLRWSTTLGETFPELREQMDPAYREVTLEWLLQNRGGMPTALDAGGVWGRLWSFTGSPQEARLLLVREVTQRKPAAAPGTKVIYSNAGFSAAGAMLERITGTAWEELVQRELFTPLGMTTVGFGAPGTAEKLDQPRGHKAGWFRYTAIQPAPTGADNPPAIAPAGRVHCSFADWAKFVSLHLRGARAARGLLQQDAGGDGTSAEPKLGAAALLPPAAFKKLHAPCAAGEEYAMGWVSAERWGTDAFWHNGSNTFWYVLTWVAPEKNFAVLIGTNAGGQSATLAADDAAELLARRAMKARE